MDRLWRELHQLVNSLVQRLSQLLSVTPLQLTGVLGLAAVLYGLYHIRNSSRRKARPASEQGRREDSGQGASASGLGVGGPQPSSLRKRPQAAASSPQAAVAAVPAGEQSLAQAIRSRLAGLRAISISAPGVLLEEWTPGELEEAATLREDAAEVVRAIASFASVYLITQVEDDTGEATCRGALEAGGLVGPGPGQIPAHRLLFCSTLEGKMSIVRQLEPQLHVDGHPQTVEDLKRFVKLVHICPPGRPPAGAGSPSVGSAPSLAGLFKPQ